MTTQINLFTEKITSRLEFVLNHIESYLGCEVNVITETSQFLESQLPKINYSQQDLGGIHIQPQGLLFETNIHNFDFQTLENDALSMMFFLLSRYEEYLGYEPDAHGRFPSKSSYMYKTDRYQKPWVDNLIEALKDKLIQQHPSCEFKKYKFEKQLTLDIDQAFLYQNKSFKRFVGGNLNDASKKNFKSIIDRKMSYFKLKKDPWDIYDQLEYDLSTNQTLFFFQVGKYGEYDKNLSIDNGAFRKVIRKVSKWAKVGLHPSYQSNQDIEMLKFEKAKLEEVLGESVTDSRQHYIILNLPETYRNLIQIGITDDYTMGYADAVGFRASTSHAFYWYDLQNEKQTTLRVHPFCAMDVTLKHYMSLRWEHSNFVLKRLEEEVRQVNGKMRLIAHNESLSGYGDWEKWNTVLLDFVLS